MARRRRDLPVERLGVFSVTNGIRVRMYLKKTSLSSLHCASSTPVRVSMPLRFRAASPLPETTGLGSIVPMTTRAGFSFTRRSTQGGVLPWWEQGSRVMYTVEPRTGSVALSMALISAWFSPQHRWYPFPMTRPFLTITAPTRGLGQAQGAPRLARARAIFM
jgi:hypothetical protein